MKNYVVFGGSGGIGTEVARELRTRGERVCILARDSERLEKVANEIGAIPLVCDATCEKEVEAAFTQCLTQGEIVGVVHAVGSILLKPAHLTSAQEWEETVQKNLTSAFYIVKHSAKVMREGAVVFFSSSAAQIGLPNHEAIAAVKAGIEGLVRSAAATYAPRNLRFNCVAPGLVRTPLSEKLFSSPVAHKASLAFHGLNRLGTPSDIAPCVAWLLTEAASWVTGQVFTIDGGLSSIKKVAQ